MAEADTCVTFLPPKPSSALGPCWTPRNANRSKFDPYVTIQDRQQFLRLLSRIADTVPIIHTVHECRDPRDNKFLELAVNGDAGFIVTGDRDLLALDPFRTIRIITPASHLAGA